MNYTTNYHLPQWVAEDRILMEDFNEAMSGIDAGLHEQKQLWDGVLQLAAHHLQQSYYPYKDSALIQDTNLLFNPLSNEEMANTLEGAQWDEERKVHIGCGSEVDRTLLRGFCTKYEAGSVSLTYSADTAVYEFVSPIDGTVTEFDLRYYLQFTTTFNALTNGKLTFNAYKKGEHSYFSIYQKKEIPFTMEGTETKWGAVPVEVEVSLEKGECYRFTLHIDSGSGVRGYLGFTAYDSSSDSFPDNSAFTIIPRLVTEGSHSRQMVVSGTPGHAAAVIWYRQDQNSGSVTATLGGTPMHEIRRSIIQAAGGKDCEVLALTCEGSFAEETSLKIFMSCSETDNLYLMGYAVLLL